MANSSTIDGLTDPEKIVDNFSEKFQNILADSRSSVGGIGTIPSATSVNGMSSLKHLLFNEKKIDINLLKINNVIGFDLIHSNHLKFTGKVTRNFISLLFKSMLSHSFIPKEMLRGHIKPTLKNAKVYITNSENYRPAMSSLVLLKLFEYCLTDSLAK